MTGQQLAVLQLSPDNLAAADSQSGRAVIYLPQTATPTQREALLAWLKSSQRDFHPAKTLTRIAPLQFVKTAERYSFKAGDFISVETKPLERCENFSCGEALWYEPRSETSLFTVAADRFSRVREPWLELKWDDHGKRNAFLARFGQPDSAKSVYMTLGEICGRSGALF